MADAKVIPFDDDRSRSGGGARPARRRTGAGGGSGRGDGSAAPVSALPGAQVPDQPGLLPDGSPEAEETDGGPGESGPDAGRSSAGGLGAADRGRARVPAAAGHR